MTHLRQTMLDELQRRNCATTTIESYLRAVEQFARYFNRSPDRLTRIPQPKRQRSRDRHRADRRLVFQFHRRSTRRLLNDVKDVGVGKRGEWLRSRAWISYATAHDGRRRIATVRLCFCLEGA